MKMTAGARLLHVGWMAGVTIIAMIIISALIRWRLALLLCQMRIAHGHSVESV